MISIRTATEDDTEAKRHRQTALRQARGNT